MYVFDVNVSVDIRMYKAGLYTHYYRICLSDPEDNTNQSNAGTQREIWTKLFHWLVPDSLTVLKFVN